MYHHVSPVAGDMITVSPAHFGAQMAFLKKGGYQTLDPDQLLAVLEGREKPSKRSVLITFDDGFLDNYLFAYPVIKKLGLNATIFVVTGWVEAASGQPMDSGNFSPVSHKEAQKMVRSGHAAEVIINWDQAREMEESGSIRIESHLNSHQKNLSREQLGEELVLSRKLIEKNLRKKCQYLGWPWGNFDREAIDLAKKSGYKGMFTVFRGINGQGSDPARIRRIAVKDTLPGWWLRKTLFLFSHPRLGGIYAALKPK
jgi:peptidoglycan/xylan/chitin deacetylase (PgdA/CDA1 family)